MALTEVSIEMSFSLSSMRSALRSMSIGFPGARRLIAPVEFNLDLSGTQRRITEPAAGAVDVQDHVVGVCLDHPALDGSGWRPRQRGAAQPAQGALPVSRLRERAIHAR